MRRACLASRFSGSEGKIASHLRKDSCSMVGRDITSTLHAERGGGASRIVAATSGGPMATKTSLVYSHILIYRLVMNVLYRGGYRTRFQRILERVPRGTRSLCDLCFGDTYIAEWCRAREIAWTGIDLNQGFCARAVRKGFHALCADVLSTELPEADVYVMAGSFFYFHNSMPRLLERILSRTRLFVLSEPVRNLASSSGFVGRLASRSTDPGSGHTPFRFDAESLVRSLRAEQSRVGFKLAIISEHRDLLVELAR
ncbi:MAG TPA: class I SAM-dependent methyltransferase [Gemmatimonadales bacterium]|nr:class I SAM-dependent methyltransferase [Gemmatimonadales bacterium]